MDEHSTYPDDGRPPSAPVYQPGVSTPPIPAHPVPAQPMPPSPTSAALPTPLTTPPAPMAYGQQPMMQPQVIQQAVVAKNPGLAAFLSFLWTGAGQIYNGHIGLGLLLMAIQVVNFILIFVLIGFLTGFATWAFSIFHAYTTAQNFNRRHGVIS